MIERLRGFRDFYPEDQEIRRNLFKTMEETCREFGFKEVDGPSLESIELYAHKSGEEIMSQMFSFRDKGGREVTLVPEFTPTLSRMVSSRKDLVKPMKWYSIAKYWRYEEPQSGRFREFYQLNADILGSESILADSEIVSLSAEILRKLGVGERIKLKINSRILLDAIINKFVGEKRREVYYILDRWNKLESDIKDNIINKERLDKNIINAIASGKIIKEFEHKELDRLNSILDYVKSYSNVSIEIDLKIVRGLDYYTGFVFESWDKEEKFRAILGGGRYDNIIEQLGGEHTPAVGFGFGDAVIENIMKMEGLWKLKKERRVFLVQIDPRGRDYSKDVARKLRAKGINVDLNVMDRGVSKQLDYAAKIGYEFSVILGENEAKNGTITVKNMSTGKQSEMNIEEIDNIWETNIN